jgi:stage II sporulation protein D
MLIKGGTSVHLLEGSRRLYRGYLQVSRAGSGLQVLNQIGLDNYVKGVVSGEMPSSWLPEALKVQAVAARSYAVANGAGTKVLFSDTRSQVYSGMSGETKTGNAAVSGTRGKIVTYQGAPIVTYYFSTSGGRTENVENSFCPDTDGSCAEPYLKSVVDEYEDSPRDFWSFRFSPGNIGGRLGVGSLKAVKVTQRGASPRIVSARFRGVNGTLRVYTGPQIRSRLGTYDSWLRFYKLQAQAARAAGSAASLRGAAGPGGTPTRVTAELHARLVGSIVPARKGARTKIQRRTNGAWVTVDTVRLGAGGRYAWTATHAGTYRALLRNLDGPAVRLR